MLLLFMINLSGFILCLIAFKKDIESIIMMSPVIMTGSAIGMGLTLAYLVVG
jgi:hypothetical protein